MQWGAHAGIGVEVCINLAKFLLSCTHQFHTFQTNNLSCGTLSMAWNLGKFFSQAIPHEQNHTPQQAHTSRLLYSLFNICAEHGCSH